MIDIYPVKKQSVKVPVIETYELPKRKRRLWPLLFGVLVIATAIFTYQWYKAWNDPNYCGRPALEWCERWAQ